MRPEDTAAAGGDQTPPVLMDLRCELINAPKHIKALWAIQQVMDNLDLSHAERLHILKYLRKITQDDAPPF